MLPLLLQLLVWDLHFFVTLAPNSRSGAEAINYLGLDHKFTCTNFQLLQKKLKTSLLLEIHSKKQPKYEEIVRNQASYTNAEVYYFSAGKWIS